MPLDRHAPERAQVRSSNSCRTMPTARWQRLARSSGLSDRSTSSDGAATCSIRFRAEDPPVAALATMPDVLQELVPRHAAHPGPERRAGPVGAEGPEARGDRSKHLLRYVGDVLIPDPRLPAPVPHQRRIERHDPLPSVGFAQVRALSNEVEVEPS